VPEVEHQLAVLDVEDVRRHRIEDLAVVADDDESAPPALQIRLEPQRRLEVEMVGRLVEQQQVGLGEQRRGKRDAHAPAA